MNDNHKDQQKTPEQLKQEKIDKFNKDPDGFIDKEDMVIAMFRDNGKLRCFMGGATRLEVVISKGELDYKLTNFLAQIDTQKSIAQSSKIIKPQKGAFGRIFRR